MKNEGNEQIFAAWWGNTNRSMNGFWFYTSIFNQKKTSHEDWL